MKDYKVIIDKYWLDNNYSGWLGGADQVIQFYIFTNAGKGYSSSRVDLVDGKKSALAIAPEKKYIDYVFRVLERLESILPIEFELVDDRNRAEISLFKVKNAGKNAIGMAHGWWTSTHDLRYDLVWEATGDKREDMRTIIHEIGHALGLDDLTSRNARGWDVKDSLMLTNKFSKNTNLYPLFFTSKDVKALHDIWGDRVKSDSSLVKGNNYDNLLQGSLYSDTVIGSGGSDFIETFDGDDLIDPGLPGLTEDKVYTGPGSDTIIVKDNYFLRIFDFSLTSDILDLSQVGEELNWGIDSDRGWTVLSNSKGYATIIIDGIYDLNQALVLE